MNNFSFLELLREVKEVMQSALHGSWDMPIPINESSCANRKMEETGRRRRRRREGGGKKKRKKGGKREGKKERKGGRKEGRKERNRKKRKVIDCHLRHLLQEKSRMFIFLAE